MEVVVREFAHDAASAAPADRPEQPRVLIVAENASWRFGGEAVLPLHYFRRLHARGVPVWLITNERNRAELSAALLPAEIACISYAPDTWLHRLLYRAGKLLPPRLATFLVGWFMHVLGQAASRRIARRLIREHGISVVHQPTPVSPRQVSLLHGLGVPVIIGPMNGGMSFPPAFKDRDRRLERLFNRVGRGCANVLNALMPGKRRARLLLVANERTCRALPPTRGQVLTMVENGVDLSLWSPAAGGGALLRTHVTTPFRCVTVGRLIRLKAIDLLFHALVAARKQDPGCPLHLEIIGDGPELAPLQTLARDLLVTDIVDFAGWRTQKEIASRLAGADAFILPSLHECGGAVVLEAMAMGLPCIVTNWGGPADYVDSTCGILVEPAGREPFIAGLADAILTLARSPELARKLGEAGRARASGQFDWEKKIDAMMLLYQRACRQVA